MFNQLEAWQKILATKQSFRYYFYEDQYDQLDWTQEPNMSWDAMCANKLLLLRQKYQRLSLFYSAGRDSHMILKQFYRTGIPLDEIICNRAPTVDNRIFELENYILPQVREFKQRYPTTEVKFVNIEQHSFEQYFNEGWAYNPYQCLRMNLYVPTDFGYYVKQYLDPDPCHGYIVGVDKPRLMIEDNKVYSVVIDKNMEPFYTDLPNLELFFFSPDYPELHLKQAWMMLNYLETNYADQLNSDFVNRFCSGLNSEPWWYDQLCLSCGRGTAFDLSLAIQNGTSKPKYNRSDPRYIGFLNQASDKLKWRSAAVWMDTAEQIKKALPKEIFKNGEFYEGLTGIISKKYYMKTLDILPKLPCSD